MVFINPNSFFFGGGGKIGHAMQNLVKSACIRTIITLILNNTNIPGFYCLSHDKYLGCLYKLLCPSAVLSNVRYSFLASSKNESNHMYKVLF